MSNIRFIVQGSPDTAADTAYELQQYLEAKWQVQIKATPADTSALNVTDANSKSIGLDPDSMKVLLDVVGFYTIIKEVVDGATGVIETKEKLKKLWTQLIEKMEPILTHNHEYLWLEVNGIPYPVKAENLDDIIKATQVQE